MATEERKLPPVWLMGLTYATFGMVGGFTAVTLPQILAAEHVPVGRIASITAVVMSSGFWGLVIAPMVDIRYRRRTYALVCGVLAALAVGWTVAARPGPVALEWVMFVGFTAATEYTAAAGGWMGSLIDKKQDSGLGMWFAASNIGAGGLMMVLASQLLALPNHLLAGMATGGLILLPMVTYFWIPAPPPSEIGALERFGKFLKEAVLLLKRRDVVLGLVLFASPAASFALTNLMGGMGADFHASEKTVGLFSGVGSVFAGVAGSLLLHPLAKRFALRPVYLGVGVAGAAFTLAQLLAPRSPIAFGVAITGENMFQALAFATLFAIIFEIMGPDNPLAGTMFSLLASASMLPILYMQVLDGQGYTKGGPAGSYLMDAGVSVAGCCAMAWVLMRWKVMGAAKTELASEVE
ncbi:MAG: MFS transporter [Terracidiphilus sp.]